MDRGIVTGDRGGDGARDPGLMLPVLTPGPDPLPATTGDNNEKKQQQDNAGPPTDSPSLRTGLALAGGGGEGSAKAHPEREATFSDYLRVFTYATKWDMVLFAAAAVASVGSGVTFPVMNIVFGQLIGDFNDYFSDTPQSKAAFNRTLNRMALYMLAIFLSRFVLNYISKFCFRLIGIRMSAAIRLDYIRSLFAQTIHVLDTMPSGAAATTITATSNTLQLGISEKLGIFLEFTATVVAAIVIAFTYSWSLTLITSSVILFIVIVLSVLVPFIVRGESRLTRAQTRAGSVAAEAFGAIRMVTSCGAEARMASRYREWVRRAEHAGHATTPFISTQFGLIFFGLYGGFALCFYYGTRFYADGTITSVGTVVIVLMSVTLMVVSLERIATPLIAVSKAMVAAAEFFTVIDAPRPKKGTLRDPHVSATADIVFRGVDFAYPARPSRKVLDGLDLRIEANKNTAIVGPSGSGKSTIVGLIEGWYMLQEQAVIAKAVQKDKDKDKEKEAEEEEKEQIAMGEKKKTETKGPSQRPWARRKKEEKEVKEGVKKNSTDGTDSGGGNNNNNNNNPVSDPNPNLYSDEKEDAGPPVELRGSITVCGHELSEVDMKWWRRQIGLVQQEPFLFNESIFKNVSAGLIGSEWEDAPEPEKRELVRQACVESFADEFIDRLPDRYDTEVGDQGAKLSGGQKQRIAIARSIVSKPKILILDEATSSIDVRGERIVQAALERASRGRTTITIAHRLSTVKNADRICVLQRGKVVEEGTHESLLAREEGVYAGLVLAQSLFLGEDEPELGGDGGRGGDGDAMSVGEEGEGEGKGTVLSLSSSPRREIRARKRSEEAGGAGVGETQIVPLPGANVLGALRQRNLFTGFGQLLREQKSRTPLYGLALLGAIGAAAAVPLQAFLFAKIVVVFLETGQQLRDDATFWSKMWAALAAGVGVSYFVTSIAAINVEHFVSSRYRQEYFESLLHQKTGYFDEDGNAAGQLTARLASDPTALKELLGINMVMVLIGMFSLVGALAISFAYGWKLATVALCVTVPLGLLAGFYRIRYELQFNEMNDAVFRESSKFGAESIAAFRTVCSLAMEDSICRRYETLLRGHVTTAYRKARWTTLIFAFADSMNLGCQTLIFWYGGRLLSTREYDVTSFLVTYMAVIQGAESAGQWLSFGPNAAQASAAASRILQARDSRRRDAVSATAESVPDTEGGVRIELQDVDFRYPTRDMSVFKGLNLTIEKGQFAALVGASGSGKTSIVSLLERFYDVDGGRICFNGRDITEVNVYEYRKLLSLVAQEPALFQGTLRENLLLGVEEEEATAAGQDGIEERLHQCCRDANIHDFIVSLPEGYNTNIGARGVSLSGGQRQRVSIARALMRNPRVLLLDEATSSLDSEAEKLVQAAFERVAKGRTTIAVAHRLATIQNADIIYVLGEGKVLEKGSHAELLKKKGVYWHMCHNQALDNEVPI